jgi:hypothetical protein
MKENVYVEIPIEFELADGRQGRMVIEATGSTDGPIDPAAIERAQKAIATNKKDNHDS